MNESVALNSDGCNLLEHVKACPLFDQTDPEILAQLVPHLRKLTLRPGEVLFRQGDESDAMFIIVSGELLVSLCLPDGSEKQLGTIGAGQAVGEMQVLTGGRRTAMVTSPAGSELVRLPRAAFSMLRERAPAVIQSLVELARYRLRCQHLDEILPKLFEGVDPAALRNMQEKLEWIHLVRYEKLFDEGDPGDCMYIVVHGRLEALVGGKSVAEISSGEMFGEIALFTGDVRTAGIRATRDCDLVRVSADSFYQLIDEEPKVMRAVVSTLVNRLLRETRGTATESNYALNVTVLPVSRDLPIGDYADDLARAFAEIDTALHVSAESVGEELGIPALDQLTVDDPQSIRLTAWLDEQETMNRFMVYEATVYESEWRRRCLRQADRVLLVAHAEDGVPDAETIQTLLNDLDSVRSATQPVLVLIHRDGKNQPRGTAQWRAALGVKEHHHVRLDAVGTFGRLARILAGKSVGLVLGGGAAKGLGHIGVIRALEEAGILIDMIGGTSMGAIIGGLYASGKSVDEITQICRSMLVEDNPFSDITVPVISLFDAIKIEKAIKTHYADFDIEDCWINFFCVASNITDPGPSVLDQGSLGTAIRASLSIPLALPPVPHGQALLVDGSLMDNVPHGIMRERKARTIIAVDVTMGIGFHIESRHMPSSWEVMAGRFLPFKKKVLAPTVPELLQALPTIVGAARFTETDARDGDLFMRLPLQAYNATDMDKLEEIVEVGYRFARERIAEWQGRSVDLLQTPAISCAATTDGVAAATAAVPEQEVNRSRTVVFGVTLLLYLLYSFALQDVLFPGQFVEDRAAHAAMAELRGLRPVKTVVVPPYQADMRRNYSGRSVSYREMQLSFRVGGKIADLPVDTGQILKKGALVARLEDRDLQLQLDRLSAELDSAGSRLRLADRQFERMHNLHENENVARNSLEKAQADAESARAQHEAIQKQLNLAENNLAYATLIAPEDGTILGKFVERSQMVAAGQPVVLFSQAGELEVSIAVPEAHIGRIFIGQQADIHFDHRPGKLFPGSISEVGVAADAGGAYSVKVTVNDPQSDLRPGMLATATITFEGGRTGTTLPATAVTGEDDRRIVWVVADGVVRKRQVEVGPLVGGNILVYSGVSEGDKIVVLGQNRLREGMKVTVMPE